MAFDSTADLLFRVSADVASAQANLASLRTAIAGTCAEATAAGDAMGSSLNTNLGGMREGFTSLTSSTRETREALRGLGEEIGVAMPRFVSSWLASIGGVSTVMAAAFAPIAVIGLVEVLSKIPTALQKGIDWLHGWTAESKKAFESATRAAIESETATISAMERFRAIGVIGLEGADRYHAALQINKQDIDDVTARLRELEKQQREARKIAGLPETPDTAGATRIMVGPENVAAPPPAHAKPTGTREGIEQAKIQLKALEEPIKNLRDQITDLTLRSRELAAQAASAAAAEAKKPLEDFTELSHVLSEVQSKLAGTGTAEDKVREEMTKLADEAGQARAKLEALNAAHKVSPETYASQMAAWQYLAKMVPELQDRMFKEIDAKRSAEIDRQNEEISTKWLAGLIAGFKKQDDAVDSLREKLAEFNVQTLADKHKAIDTEIALERSKLDEEGKLTAAASALLIQRATARHAKLDADVKLAAASELARLGEQLERIEHAHQTTEERIAGQYTADVTNFAAAEEKKVILATAGSTAQAEIAAKFAAIRRALYIKEEQDVQALHNSTGWKGVFGADFAKAIRGNEDLSEDWADAEKRSHLLVKVAMEATKEQSMELFSGMTQGMGAAIAQSLVYSKSIGGAMRETAAATLESIAAKDIVLALDSLGWGFYDLAMHDYPGAASAFKAAAIFGSVGLAAGVAGRAIAGPQSSSTTGAGAGSSLPSETAARQSNMQSGAVGSPVAAGRPHVSITIMGHVIGTSGVSELASMLNDAVLNSDVTLTSTNTKTGVQVTR